MMSTPHNISIHYYGKSKSKLTLVTTKNHMNIGSFNFGRISYMTFEIKKTLVYMSWRGKGAPAFLV